ncbi:Endoribonuclease L-PSP/chorismate mutase-like protein [Aspergillus minisclerotigenes]|uniref:Endoribonuclease L-PSP/chorismate mutase-like protein n=1 Tax=Aspergillus minisclerotigenes TaxID=656917 RepID=A0A5N6JKT9_9EURO|nr:Endoribonuclease L-PSP/chorismate mutase-like protein [Aspergillus minisclerotigenes]
MFSPRAIRSISSLNHLFYSIPSPALGNRSMSTTALTFTPVTSVQTDRAYAPFAHYSQAIKAGGQVWLSGQIPAGAQGNLSKGSTVQKTKAIIQNTEAILKEAGSGLDRVVKVVVYVKDASIITDFASMYDPAFPHRPARFMVEVSKLPAGVDIQVDFIAVV